MASMRATHAGNEDCVLEEAGRAAAGPVESGVTLLPPSGRLRRAVAAILRQLRQLA